MWKIAEKFGFFSWKGNIADTVERIVKVECLSVLHVEDEQTNAQKPKLKAVSVGNFPQKSLVYYIV